MIEEHVRRELQLIGEEQEIIEWYVDVTKAFSKIGHSGSSAAYTLEVLYKLLKFEPLTPLTDDPAEWIQHDDHLWQSQRNPAAFSLDGGRRYYLVDETKRKKGRAIYTMYWSEHNEKDETVDCA